MRDSRMSVSDHTKAAIAFCCGVLLGLLASLGSSGPEHAETPGLRAMAHLQASPSLCSGTALDAGIGGLLRHYEWKVQ
jgi:hypothetical protein